MTDFTGSSGDDIFTGSRDRDVADGMAGKDRLNGNNGNDDLAGGAGADTLSGDDGDDTLYSGDRTTDWYFPYYGDYRAPAFDTGTRVDTLRGGAGNDTIFAGYGDNVDGGDGGDRLFISFMGAAEGVTADFTSGSLVIGGGTITGIESTSWIQGSDHDDILTSGNTRSGYVNYDVLEGMGGNDLLNADYYTGNLYGGDGDDIVDGRSSEYLESVRGDAGDDTLYTNTGTLASAWGGSGDDTIYAQSLIHGGSGDDKIIVQWSYYADRVYGDSGDDSIKASDEGNFLVGGSGGDKLKGGAGNDTLTAGSLDDSGHVLADTGHSHDRLYGNAGDDLLYAGYGDDVDGGSGDDTLNLSLLGASAGVTLDTSDLAAGVSATIGHGTIQNVETLADLVGSNFGDTLTIATQDSLLTVEAGDGDDVIRSDRSSVMVDGGAGDDRFVSGRAGDSFDGGDGIDTVDYGHAKTGATVTLGMGVDDAGTGQGGDSLVHVENVTGSRYADSLTGSDGANTLRGEGGADTLAGLSGDDSIKGGDGDDILIGGAGRDKLTGGTGVDHFVFDAVTDSMRTEGKADRITDFDMDAGEKIDVHGIDAKAGGGDDAFTWLGDQAFTGHAGELRFYESAGNTFIEGDVDGDGSRDFKIRLDGYSDLVVSNLIL